MILEVDNLSKSFHQGKTEIHALKDVSFNLETAGSLAIVGPSGSGKTTLLSLLAGLDVASQGSISMLGQSLSGLSEEALTQFRAQNIGIVFQQFHLMPHLTALENVTLPLDILGKENPKELAASFLEKVGLKDRMDHLPNQLSGGECQRVAIARASVVQPKFLLADEPSGNLDTETGRTVMDLLFDLTKDENMSLILITHNEALANRCDHKIKLLGGRRQ